jgi:hypothetical protein
MIEAVENHMPQVIVIDEIGTELEAAAARTIAERGVQLVATAHGNSLGNLLVNPTLSDLVGGIQTVTLGDEEARRRHTQKSILERKAPPTFDVVVEQQSWEEVVVHRDVADTVDNMLRGQLVVAEERTREEESGQVYTRRITSGGMDVPTWGAGSLGGARPGQGFTANMFERSDRADRSARSGGGGNVNQLRQVNPPVNTRSARGAGNERIRNGQAMPAQFQAQAPVRALAPTGTAPVDMEARTAVLTAPQVAVAEYPAEETEARGETTPALKTLRLYPFGVNRDRLTEAARQLRVPILVVANQKEADAIITLKNYYRRQPERLQDAEQAGKLMIILKNNTIGQMQHALARIFDLPSSDLPGDEEQEGASGDGLSFDDPTKQAMLETEDAIHQVLNKGLTTAELPPANAYIRRLQHQMATRYNLLSRSRGKEPNRRVKIFRVRD